jgi:SAM-dependent methyltransferase
MASTAPPVIFAPARRLAARRRMRNLQERPDAPRYIMADMVEDVLDRLGFLRITPQRALLIGDWTGDLAAAFTAQGAAVTHADPLPSLIAAKLDEERPYTHSDPSFAGFDFIASLGTLDSVNDLPGALIHLRGALAPGGLMVASFMGAGSLPTLREAMREADGDRPAPRIHPQVDVRAGGQLLQRAGFSNPVVDYRSLAVRFGSLDALIADLRAQGLGNILARSGPAFGKAQLATAHDAFTRSADEGGRVTEQFEILTLSGWKI